MADEDELPGSEQPAPPRRFLTLEQVAEQLATSRAQIYAMVRWAELRAIKLGGRGQWRVERAEIDAYVAKAYAETTEWLDVNPWKDGDTATSDNAS